MVFRPSLLRLCISLLYDLSINFSFFLLLLLFWLCNDLFVLLHLLLVFFFSLLEFLLLLLFFINLSAVSLPSVLHYSPFLVMFFVKFLPHVSLLSFGFQYMLIIEISGVFRRIPVPFSLEALVHDTCVVNILHQFVLIFFLGHWFQPLFSELRL